MRNIPTYLKISIGNKILKFLSAIKIFFDNRVYTTNKKKLTASFLASKKSYREQWSPEMMCANSHRCENLRHQGCKCHAEGGDRCSGGIGKHFCTLVCVFVGQPLSRSPTTLQHPAIFVARLPVSYPHLYVYRITVTDFNTARRNRRLSEVLPTRIYDFPAC